MKAAITQPFALSLSKGTALLAALVGYPEGGTDCAPQHQGWRQWRHDKTAF
jgi:hypothetical protein